MDALKLSLQANGQIMEALSRRRPKTSSFPCGHTHEPAIARYFAPEQIARFHAELSLLCQQRRKGQRALTAREINEEAALILARAARR